MVFQQLLYIQLHNTKSPLETLRQTRNYLPTPSLRLRIRLVENAGSRTHIGYGSLSIMWKRRDLPSRRQGEWSQFSVHRSVTEPGILLISSTGKKTANGGHTTGGRWNGRTLWTNEAPFKDSKYRHHTEKTANSPLYVHGSLSGGLPLVHQAAGGRRGGDAGGSQTQWGTIRWPLLLAGFLVLTRGMGASCVQVSFFKILFTYTVC